MEGQWRFRKCHSSIGTRSIFLHVSVIVTRCNIVARNLPLLLTKQRQPMASSSPLHPSSSRASSSRSSDPPHGLFITAAARHAPVGRAVPRVNHSCLPPLRSSPPNRTDLPIRHHGRRPRSQERRVGTTVVGNHRDLVHSRCRTPQLCPSHPARRPLNARTERRRGHSTVPTSSPTHAVL